MSAAVAGCGGGSSDSGAGSPPPSPVTTHTVEITPTPTPPEPTPTPTPSAAPSTAPQAAACTTGQLKLTLGSGQGTAGSTYQPIILTNTSSGPCSLTGYPGVSFVDASGAQLGKSAARNNQPYHAVTLAGSGGQASALLRLPDPGVFSPSDCNQATAAKLKVYPPNQTGALVVSDAADVCTTKTGRTVVGPMHAGTDG